LHNIGGLSDVSTILKSQAENDENQISSSYTFIHAMVWAIPVLGFIGTVQGLSMAIGTFTKTLQSSGDLSAIKTNLQGVTSGLATAFETTLVALVCALAIQMYLNFMQQRETDFLDECNDYCHSHVIAKLKTRSSNGDGVAKQ
jgi:biopolymer transport protein ExbB/TolQ